MASPAAAPALGASSVASVPSAHYQPPAANVGLPAIGVLLPLSGRYQPFGESCLRGIRVALGALEGRTPVLRAVILDTRGEPNQAVSAYQKLASDPGVVAVLGPMLSPEVDAVQSYVHGYELPTLNFSQRPVAAGGPLYRFSLTKQDQAKILAKYAVGELGARRWAAFHPDDDYGREISAYFRQSRSRASAGASSPTSAMIRARTIFRRKRSAYRPSSASSKTRRRRRTPTPPRPSMESSCPTRPIG